jgi:sigma-B regulation protein RsbU (phosphoserine phosphatase)
VGGDFYDVIALGDNCVGLVMADVWGKGMPAALFMALTHSLVRAEAQRCARWEQFDDIALLVAHLRSHW